MARQTLDYSGDTKGTSRRAPLLILFSVLIGCWAAPGIRSWTVPQPAMMIIPAHARFVVAICIVLGMPALGTFIAVLAWLLARGRTDSYALRACAIVAGAVSTVVLLLNGLGLVLVMHSNGPG